MSTFESSKARRHEVSGAPERRGGYAAIRDYAAIGDGRTMALVARDGSTGCACPTWTPRASSVPCSTRNRGGRSVLAPETPYTVERRYLPGTNVLETTFLTAEGVVRVTDAMTLPARGPVPIGELARRIEGLSGGVPLRWSVEPRFGYGVRPTQFGRRSGIPVATSGADAMAICSWGAGEPQETGTGIAARMKVAQGNRALIALPSAHQEPLPLPSRQEVEARIDATIGSWRRWLADRRYDGPWEEAVHRSALALALLVHAPSGALAAAATTSLPESIAGERNWDYRCPDCRTFVESLARSAHRRPRNLGTVAAHDS